MAETDKIIQELNKRFAQPLPEFYRRRIIFWQDDDKEFEDKLEDFTLENAKLVILGARNQFAVKKLVAHDDPDSNLLIYTNVSYVDQDEDWLLNVKLYSEEFRSDLLSQHLQEMDIENLQPLREAVRSYRKFFGTKGHRTKVANLTQRIATTGQVHMAVLAVLSGLKDPRPEGIIRTVLQAGLEGDNGLYSRFCEYGAKDAFWAMTAQLTGFVSQDDDLAPLAAHILLTASTQTLREDYLSGLESYIATAHKAHCYNLISNWMHTDNGTGLRELATHVEDELQLRRRLVKLEIEDLVETECFPCIDEIILDKLMFEIGENHIVNVGMIQETINQRRTGLWFNDIADYYAGIAQVANMQEFYSVYAGKFHTVEPAAIWKDYTETYYQMDTYYRLFHCAYGKIKLAHYDFVQDLEDPFKKVVDKVEALYTGWFLGQLGENWAKACEGDLAEFGCVPAVEQQTDFYRRRVASGGAKTFVIISDALRYEVAATLAVELEQGSHSKVTLDACESIFPAVTKYGMAALLPHSKLSIEMKNDVIDILADGITTKAGYREKILKNKNPNSVVLRYKDFADWSRAERSASTKGMDVIYIYHDVIDMAGHNTETKMFQECQTAIDELKKLVRDLVNDCNGTRILITSDHGFLYTYAPLKESSKVSKESFKDTVVECDRRYALLTKGATPEHLIPVKFFRGETDYDGFAPKENIRIKTHGSQNYVHGGISLQERVVPIITYHHVRTTGAEYRKNASKYKTEQVDVELLSAARKTSNMIFALDFYQKDAVGTNREAATYRVYMADSTNAPVSDYQTIIADKTSDDIKQRQFRVTLKLKPLKYTATDTYFLVIEHTSGHKETQKIPFQIDIAFAVEDFSFDIF